MAEHHVEAAGQEVRAGVPAVALDQPHPLADARGLAGQRRRGRASSIAGSDSSPVDLVAGAGQPQGLGALAHADVEHPQPLPHREAGADLLVELPGHQLLADDVAQSAEAAEPAGRAADEAGSSVLRAALRA